MGIFGQSSELDADIDLVTDEKNTVENWASILDICDRASKYPKPALRSILRRLNDKNPHVQLQAITLLSACVSNCGRLFLLEVASRDFESELNRLITGSHTHRRVKHRLLASLQSWADGEFKSDTQLSLIPCLCRRLRSEGVFDQYKDESSSEPPSVMPVSADPNVVSSQQEEDDIAKAIALSMKDSKESTRSAPSSLYPSTSAVTDPPVSDTTVAEKKVRALYDFEAVEDNELTFKTGEIIIVSESSDPNWWLGSNHRGRGLFPSNFVTSDLSPPPEIEERQQRKSVQFSDDVHVRAVDSGGSDPPSSSSSASTAMVQVDGDKMERLLHLLNEADPTGGRPDSEEMLQLEEQCLAMGPLIDQELERVDKRHALLTKTSSELVEAMNLYHQLMRDTVMPPPSAAPFYSTPPIPPTGQGVAAAASNSTFYQLPQQGYAPAMTSNTYPITYQTPGYATPGAVFPPPGALSSIPPSPGDLHEYSASSLPAAVSGPPWNQQTVPAVTADCDPAAGQPHHN